MLRVGLSLLLLFASAQCVLHTAEVLGDVFHIATKVPLAMFDVCPETNTGSIQYYLYNQRHRDTPVLVTSRTWNAVDLSSETKILIHGWLGSPTEQWLLDAKNNYLEKGNYNIIVVGWKELAEERYATAYCSAPEIGKDVAAFIYNVNVVLSKTHLIGYCMGAHIAGFAGQHIQTLYEGEKLERITALDASGPLYETRTITGLANPDERLSSDDANFVDAIHTNGLIFGFQAAFGHADFYVNGGVVQLGCPIFTIPLSVSHVAEMFTILTCSHDRSRDYFIESINSDNLKASKSGLCIINCPVPDTVMGEGCLKNTRGEYSITTNTQPPYGKTEESSRGGGILGRRFLRL